MIPTHLPPRRLRRRATHEQQWREALALDRRDSELREQQRTSRRLVPVDPPIRAGWERYWALRPDVARSDDGAYLKRVLKLVQVVEQCGKGGRVTRRDWRRGNKVVEVQHRLGTVSPDVWRAMTPRMQRYFTAHVWPARVTKYGVHQPARITFVVTDQWMFVSRVRPHYVTERWVTEFDGEGEQAWVRHRLWGYEHGYKVRRLVHECWDGRGPRYNFGDGPFDGAPLVEDGDGRWVVDIR
jgi:hypothetical protein